MFRDTDMNRRRLLALGGGVVAAVLLPSAASAQKSPKPERPQKPVAETAAKAGSGRRFFTAAEFALVDEVGEMIVPADEVSGGARAAQVAEYIDARLGESLDTAMKQSWRDDLAEINRLSGLSFGKPFMSASVAERTRLLERISRNERNPKDPGDFAFGTIKWQVTFVYYKTKIGIHDDLKYQGNTILDEFVGADPGKL